MVHLDAEKVEKLLHQIAGLETVIDNGSEEGRTRLRQENVDVTLNAIPHMNADPAQFDRAAWEKLDDKGKKKRYHSLAKMRDKMYELAGIGGPQDPEHFMHSAFASNGAIGTAIVISLVITIGLLFLIFDRWPLATGTDLSHSMQAATTARGDFEKTRDVSNATNAKLAENELDNEGAQDDDTRDKHDALVAKATADRERMEMAELAANAAAAKAIDDATQKGPNERSVLVMVTLLGGLGGSLHLLRSVVTYVGNRQLRRSWILYYVAMPFTGAGLAPIVYMLLRVGVLTPSGGAGNGSSISNLNLIGIYAFAALTGLFAKTALDKLSEVFATMFRTSGESKSADPLAPSGTSGGA